LDDKLVNQDNTEVTAEASSVSLIKWSDAVINFGSSIGIEALLQDKIHINPFYLHSNQTIFDKTDAGHRPKSNAETMDVLQQIHQQEIAPIPNENKKELYRCVIYGGKSEHDVLKSYRDFLNGFAVGDR
jgi:hypothetical protein